MTMKYSMFCECSSGFGCRKCNLKIKELETELENNMKKERKYLPTVSDLIDRLSIAQLKEWFIPEHKKEYAEEIQNILHDIDLDLQNKTIDANFVRDVIVLALTNREIWLNESEVRKGNKNGDLHKTHSLNGLRNRAKNKLQALFGGRKDYKIDCLAAEYSNYEPSGYQSTSLELNNEMKNELKEAIEEYKQRSEERQKKQKLEDIPKCPICDGMGVIEGVGEREGWSSPCVCQNRK